MRGCIAVILAGVAVTSMVLPSAADDAKEKIPMIAPEDARKFIGKEVSVSFVVKASKDSRKRKLIFLDSKTNHQDEDNLGITLSDEAVEQLRQQKNVNTPAEYYREKKIRVVGKVIEREEHVYIDVAAAEQIDVVLENQK